MVLAIEAPEECRSQHRVPVHALAVLADVQKPPCKKDCVRVAGERAEHLETHARTRGKGCRVSIRVIEPRDALT